MMGFLQGTITATLLLRQARNGEARWAGLRYGILLCGGCREDVGSTMGEKLAILMVHLHELEDMWLANSRILAKCFLHDSANYGLQRQSSYLFVGQPIRRYTRRRQQT